MENLIINEFNEGLKNFDGDVIINSVSNYNPRGGKVLDGLIGNTHFEASCNDKENTIRISFDGFSLSYDTKNLNVNLSKLKDEFNYFEYEFSLSNLLHYKFEIKTKDIYNVEEYSSNLNPCGLSFFTSSMRRVHNIVSDALTREENEELLGDNGYVCLRSIDGGNNVITSYGIMGEPSKVVHAYLSSNLKHMGIEGPEASYSEVTLVNNNEKQMSVVSSESTIQLNTPATTNFLQNEVKPKLEFSDDFKNLINTSFMTDEIQNKINFIVKNIKKVRYDQRKAIERAKEDEEYYVSLEQTYGNVSTNSKSM